MQNVSDMIEVQSGIFIPTIESVLTDEWNWKVSNKGYSCIIDKNTRKILIAYHKGTDGVQYAEDHYDCPIFVIGGLPDDIGVRLGGVL